MNEAMYHLRGLQFVRDQLNPKICKWCEKRYTGASYLGVFCSDQCASEHIKEQAHDQRLEDWKNRQDEINQSF